MLKRLRLQNIILVEQAEILFDQHLNILTGETGAGKSALMNGLSLAVGNRSDNTMLRQGCEKGTVEASFDIEEKPEITRWLNEIGVDHDISQELVVRREICVNGKNRAFINNQQIQLALLKQLGSQLAKFVSQHANHDLFSIEYHREALDTYIGLEPLLNQYKKHYIKENAFRKELDDLNSLQSQRLREIDKYQNEINEIEEASLKEGEEEELFTEYSRLYHAKEIGDKIFEINQILTNERHSVLAALNRAKMTLEGIVGLDLQLAETAKSFNNCLVELHDISHSLQKYQSSIYQDPDRLEFINDRLLVYNKIKKKYGDTFQPIQDYYLDIKGKLKKLLHADEHIDEIKNKLREAEIETNRLAEELSTKRKAGSSQLEEALTFQIRSLNMTKAKFLIEISTCQRTSFGDDKIEFYLQPNVGEREIALKDGVSGGEISRILLALQTLLAGKGKISTLVFDEIDANIGGETAAMIGEKLEEIGSFHQVICVTHFPQVAKKAKHHFRISKHECEGRTLTTVQKLDAKQQQKELDRMIGIKIE